jgi:SAM-dependent methyltransferase
MSRSTKLDYEALNRPVLEAVPTAARAILDVGCGTGSLGRALKARQPARVVGLTYSASEAERAADALDHVVVQDLNQFNPNGLGPFDCVVCSHVLEHLNWPDEFLRRARPLLLPGGTLVVALPNALHWKERWRFLRGRFRYTDGGIMDRTHFRFFDWVTARDLVTEAGFVLADAFAEGGFPLSRFLPLVGHRADRLAARWFPGLFGVQFVMRGHVAPTES